MYIPILRKDVFPLCCRNCNKKYDVEGFIDAVNLHGLIYAESGPITFQGLTCPDCFTTTIIQSPATNPVVDLRNFIVVPNLNQVVNTIEQLTDHRNSFSKNDLSGFKYIPAWDEEDVNRDHLRFSCEHIITDYERTDDDAGGMVGDPATDITYSAYREGQKQVLRMTGQKSEIFEINEPDFDNLDTSGLGYYVEYFRNCHDYYMLDRDELERKLEDEVKTHTVRARRVYPDIPKFRSLLTCISPKRITDIRNGIPYGKDYSAKEIEERNLAWLELLEETSGEYLIECVRRHFESVGQSDFDEKKYNAVIDEHLTNLNYEPTERLRELSKRLGFERTIWVYFEEILKDLIPRISTEMILLDKRKLLCSWVEEIDDLKKDQKALFVDAPMGLGKTHSIVEALSDNPDLSAVVFMPTNKLCIEMVTSLKTKIALKKGYDNWIIANQMEQFSDEDGKSQSRINREFLQHEVYFLDGINENECLHYDDIIGRYSKKWMKWDICIKCEKKIRCRFLSHPKKAPLSRIIVTNHFQYDRIYSQPNYHKWVKYGLDRKEDAVMRDVFIVDEDIVLSKCYNPFSLGENEITDFTGTFIDHLNEFEDTTEISDKIDNLTGKIGRCKSGDSFIIPPVDPSFTFSEEIRKKWTNAFVKRTLFIPEILDIKETVGNHLQVIESAIRMGVVVEKKHSWTIDSKGGRKVYFPNPKTYDLSGLPPHVFFDGTIIPEDFLKHKLRNVKFKPFPIELELPCSLKVWQNVNTDLPKMNIHHDRLKVEAFVPKLLAELGTRSKYYFIATKATRDGYLDEFLKNIKNENKEFEYEISHYKNQKGINDAKDCKIGVMLGSYIVPDTVEVAMALEHIQKIIPKKRITKIRNKLWKLTKSKSQREYTKKYRVVGEMAEALRWSEQRQGIARTRYISHDVDFYVLSKDRVDKYEPFAHVETDQYGIDIPDFFQPRPGSPENTYPIVEEVALKWLDEHDTLMLKDIFWKIQHKVKASEIPDKEEVSRITISKHLTKMVEDGLLLREHRSKKYRLPPDQ